MRVLLVDVDSKIPNLALMKISAWHKTQGDETGLVMCDPGKVYISCVFKENADQARGIASLYPNAEIDIGGSGIDLKKELPPDVEVIKPDYDLYPSDYSQGYTSRGCIRKCEFCIVPEKEGKIRPAQHPEEFHDPRFSSCMIMDNNLFATPQIWQDNIFEWFAKNKIKMISPQGWDVRLLNEHRATLLKSIKHEGVIHFAWDSMAVEPGVVKGIKLLKNAGFNLADHKISFYVLVGFNTTFEQDLYRCRKLKELGVQAYVMRYKKTRELNALARWTNNSLGLFWSVDFDQTVDGRKVMSRRSGTVPWFNDKFAAQMVCCVCGARLPVLENRQAYLDRHCACIMPDGSIRYYCPGTRHSAQEIDEAIHGLPVFTTGSVLKKKQNLI